MAEDELERAMIPFLVLLLILTALLTGQRRWNVWEIILFLLVLSMSPCLMGGQVKEKKRLLIKMGLIIKGGRQEEKSEIYFNNLIKL